MTEKVPKKGRQMDLAIFIFLLGTLPRVRSAVVLRTAGDPRRIRSLQPVQPAVLLLTAGHPRRTHSLLPVQPAVLFTCGGCSQFLYIPPYLLVRVVSTIMDFMIRIMIDKIQDCTAVLEYHDSNGPSSKFSSCTSR